MKNKTLLARIVQAIELPNLERNKMGQVKAALKFIPVEMQELLACDFVERAIQVLPCDEPSRQTAAIQLVQAIREYCRGSVSVSDVHSKAITTLSFERLREVHDAETSPREMYTPTNVGHLLRLLTSCCCQRELESEGLVYPASYQPDAFSIFQEVIKKIKGERALGKRVSDEIADWTLQQIVAKVKCEVMD